MGTGCGLSVGEAPRELCEDSAGKTREAAGSVEFEEENRAVLME